MKVTYGAVEGDSLGASDMTGAESMGDSDSVVVPELPLVPHAARAAARLTISKSRLIMGFLQGVSAPGVGMGWTAGRPDLRSSVRP